MISSIVNDPISAGMNAYMSSVIAKYNFNTMDSALMTSLPIFRPRAAVDLNRDSTSTLDDCYLLTYLRTSPKFSKYTPQGSPNCGSAPNLKSFSTDTCTSIGNRFSHYTLNIVNSAKDADVCLSGVNARFAYLALLTARMPSLYHDLCGKVLDEFFTGFYNNFKVNYRNSAEEKPWYALSALDGKVMALPTAGLSAFSFTNLNAEFVNNNTFPTYLGKYTMFVGASDFNKYVKTLADKNMTCCNLAVGMYDVNPLSRLQTYTDAFTGLKICLVPDRFLKYDPTSKKLIYPIINTENYFVTTGSDMYTNTQYIRTIGVSNCERRVLNIANIPVYYRAANGLIHFEDAAWEEFIVTLGAVRTSLTDTISFILGSDTRTEQEYANKHISAAPVGIPSTSIIDLS